MRLDLTIVSFLCAFLVLIPLPWHWRARNVATLSLIAWLAILNISRGVDTIVWADSTVVKFKVWCDITTRLYIGANVGLPAATVCICRYLAQVASPRHTLANAADKRRRLIFELVMCIGLPIIEIICYYIVQDHRFDIFQDFGCNATIYVSVAALFLVYLPPVVLSFITLIYAGIALRWFVHRRAQFQAVLQSSQSGLTTGRYLRLIALSITEMLVGIAMTMFVMIINVAEIGIRPWVSWEFVHADFGRVDQYAKVLVPQYFWDRYTLICYTIPVTSVIFFAFFGFGQEATAEYLKYFRWVKVNIFRIKPKPAPVLPVSGRGGVSGVSSTFSVPAHIKLQTETTVSGQEKLDDAPHSTYTTSRPASPANDRQKGALDV